MSVPLDLSWGDRRQRGRGPWPRLHATWEDVLLVSFPLDAADVRPWVPSQLDLDLWGGHAWVSLVGLRFTRLRVGEHLPLGPLGRFGEINARTYVTHSTLGPGVFFWRELVPWPWIAWTARGLWGEPYRVARVRREGPLLTPSWAAPGVSVRGAFDLTHGALERPAAGRLERWLIDRFLGFRPRRHGQLASFRVAHPPWLVRKGVGNGRWTAAGMPIPVPDRSDLLALWSPGSRVAISPPFAVRPR